MDSKHSGFKLTSNRIPRASAREEPIRIEETKGGVVITGTSYLHVVKGGSINKGFNLSMDESCSSAPAHVRRGTVKDAEAHEESRKHKPGDGDGYGVTP